MCWLNQRRTTLRTTIAIEAARKRDNTLLSVSHLHTKIIAVFSVQPGKEGEKVSPLFRKCQLPLPANSFAFINSNMKALCATGKKKELQCCGNGDTTSCCDYPFIATDPAKCSPAEPKSVFSGPNFKVDIEFKEINFAVKVKGRGMRDFPFDCSKISLVKNRFMFATRTYVCRCCTVLTMSSKIIKTYFFAIDCRNRSFFEVFCDNLLKLQQFCCLVSNSRFSTFLGSAS